MSESSIPLAEVAALLGVHYMTAYRYVRLGHLAATQERGRWVVSPEELARFQGRSPRPTAGRKPAALPRALTAELVERFKGRLLDGDEPGAWRLAEDLIATGAERSTIYLELLAPAMRSVGD